MIMRHFSTIFLVAGILCSTVLNAGQPGMYVLATDYAAADGKTDVADKLQEMIDTNPNRTIFFPDGVYMLSHSLVTPADPTKAVHLVLANFAVLKAAPDWQGGPLVRLGGKLPYNSTVINGSNYGIEGGIFDGSGVADGISIESGRETRINHASVKHVFNGLHIMYGANSGSSDADIVDCNIIGSGASGSTGILIEGYDNTLTNIRLAGFCTGIQVKSGGNSLINIHPLTGADYPNSCGFRVENHNNRFEHCYSDQFAIGFYLTEGVICHFDCCWAWWYNNNVPVEKAIVCEGELESYFYGMRTSFNGEHPAAAFIEAKKGGHGYIEASWFPENAKWTPEDASDFYVRH